MSVVAIIRFDVSDMALAIKTIRSKDELLESIAADAKAHGALHHRFVHDGKQLVVVDEWDTPQSFQAFFDGNTKIAEVTAEAGVRGAPTSEFYETIDSADAF
ncbi:hypothetical protein FOS14_13945 [Skermania sp. ID1734]|uniref:hypothetical protein n=1 Tax=Skermania sp. ID1734 TaxID=2597516 RepID=UPI00117D0830|nr:hypothetical protein [Skermania sp. ID1734]TSD98093.1 hypothetical protein FOS14_13945 [Skermania sp. ID1734]